MKPLLKWAGGKRWLVSKYPELFDLPMKRYIEPFFGGGAVFFDIEPDAAIISDRNASLINLYRCISTRWRDVEERLKKHAKRHNEAHYYKVRGMQYPDRYDRAAQMLYLNRTCWNGLYRENLSGQFNVPKGTKDEVLYPDDDFAGVARLLRRASISCSDFEQPIAAARSGDFVFIDPPYTVKHNNNGFIKYNETIFSWDDQIRLANVIRRRSECGANFLITNAFHESLIELYEQFADVVRVNRASVISGKSGGRGRTDEAIILVGPHWTKFDVAAYCSHERQAGRLMTLR